MLSESKVRRGMTFEELMDAVGPAPCVVLATDTLLPDVDDRPRRRKSGGAPRASERQQAPTGAVSNTQTAASR